jgi:hypothetical protein
MWVMGPAGPEARTTVLAETSSNLGDRQKDIGCRMTEASSFERTQQSRYPKPPLEDGNRSSFRNDLFFRTPDDRQSPEYSVIPDTKNGLDVDLLMVKLLFKGVN